MGLLRTIAALAFTVLFPWALLAESPNLVLISLDTFRADRLAPWGGPADLAPNLNGLAAKGTAFTDCFAPAPETLPSHATMLTGAEPPVTSLRSNGLGRLNPQVRTLAEALSARGYTTAAVVSSTVLASRYGLGRGFGTYDDALGLAGSRPAGEVTDRAVAFLKVPRQGPVFLWAHYFDAHFPYRAPEAFLKQAKGAAYDAACAYVDSEVGRLLKALPPNTLVAVVSDHGEALGDHGEPTHGVFLFQPTVRVVCLLYGPGILQAKTVSTPCSLADLARTFGKAAGVPAEALDTRGEDLATLSREASPAGRAFPLEAWLPFAQFRWRPLTGVTDGRFKWVRGKADHLYDLSSDPGETRDLAAAPPAGALALKAKLPDLPAEPPSGAQVDPSLRGLGYAPVPGGHLDLARLPDPYGRVKVLQDIDQARLDRVTGKVEEALQRLKDSTDQDPGDPTAWFEYGETLRQAGRAEAAVKALDHAVAAAPEMAEAWTSRGHALVTLEKPGEAATCYEKALNLQPGYTGALNPLAAYYLDQNQPGRAVPLLDRAVDTGIADSNTYLLRGRVRLVQSRPAEAARDFEAALRLSSRPDQTLKGEADIYMVRKRYEEGLRLYNEGVRLYPAYAPNYLTLGSYYLQAEQPERAYPLFKRALACGLDPKTRAHVEEIVKGLEGVMSEGEGPRP